MISTRSTAIASPSPAMPVQMPIARGSCLHEAWWLSEISQTLRRVIQQSL